MAANNWLNGLGCPLGIETLLLLLLFSTHASRLNGLGCPLGIETGYV